MSGRLRSRIENGLDAPEERVRAAWRVRVEMLSLSRTAEEDWDAFCAFVRDRDTMLITFDDGDHDDGDAVVGFFTMTFVPMEHAGQRRLLLFSKYFYFKARVRGHYKTLLAPWLVLPRALARYGLRRIELVASTYPQSYVSLSRTAGGVHALRSETIGAWQRVALERFAQRTFGDNFDADSGVVSNQNVVDAPALPRNPTARRLTAEYERFNPGWQAGRTLPVIFALDGRMVRHVGARVVRRLLPRRRVGSR